MNSLIVNSSPLSTVSWSRNNNPVCLNRVNGEKDDVENPMLASKIHKKLF